MKQTNNAIKFLMAQYRAIFQNAYFKGLATAAVVTMGLAAGQAQAASPGAGAYSDTVTTDKTEITIDGNNVTDPDSLNNLSNYTTIGIAADKDDSGKSITITKGEKANNFIKGNAAINYKANNLTIATGDAGHGLTITGQASNKSVAATFNEITITKGDLELVGDAAGKATLQANKISLSSDTANAALLTVGANTITGYDLTKKGAAEQDPAAGAAKDLANYTSLELGANSKLASTASASDATVLNVGSLSINGGDLNVAQGAKAATDALTLNIVEGELAEGKITTVASGTLSVKFADGDFVKDGAAVDKKLTLTKGTLDLTGGMTLSGEGKLVVTDKLDDLTVTAGAGITLTEKAAFAPTDVANAKAVAAKLPIKIGANGVLDFGSTAANLDELTFHTDASASTSDTKIGLAATGVIKGDTLSLTQELGTAGVVSGQTLNLGKNDAAEVAFATSTFKVGSNLNVGTNTKAKDVVLTAGDVAAINKAHDSVLDEATKKALIKADALAQTGSFGTVEGVTEGKLTIADAGKLDVVNGSWNTNGVDIVLGSGSTAGNLNVGATDATLGTNKTAAKLVFGADSVLTLTKGTVAVGSTSNANLLGAELDISALDSDSLVFTSGSFTAESGGTIVVNQDFINTLTDTTVVNRQATISSGGIFEVVEGLEIDADKLGTSAGNNTLAFTGKTGAGLQATLKSDSVTINKATGTSVNIGEFGVIEANTLTLNNDNQGTLENVQLDSGSFIVKQTLTSDGSDLKATLGSANSVLQLGKIVKNNGEDELASASGSVGLDLDLTAGSKVNVVGGQWGLQDVTVTDGTVKVGNDDPVYDANDNLISAQVTGGKLTHSAGTVTINEGSSAQFTELFTTNGATTTVNGVLTVIGQQNAVTTENTKADFGASINNEVTVTGANSKLVIGTTALGSIAGYQDAGAGINYTTDVDPLFGTNGKVSLDQFGTLELQFAENTKFNLNELASLRKGVTDSDTALEAGFISIGNASLTDSVVSGGTITAENLDKIKDFKDIVIKDIADATVTGVDSTTVVTGNVGNIQANANVSKVNIGQATLNKANKDGQFAVDANGKQVDLAVSKEGGYLHLVNDGEAKNITLANGFSATQKTNLVVKGKADGQTTINSVKADKSNVNTNFEVASGNVNVTQGVQVGTLNTAKDTTLTAESLNITASTSGTTSEIWGAVNVAKNATFAGDLNVGGQFAVSGDLAANGKETS